MSSTHSPDEHSVRFDLLTENLGLDPENVLTMQIWLPDSRYTDGAHIAQFYDEALARISALPTRSSKRPRR